MKKDQGVSMEALREIKLLQELKLLKNSSVSSSTINGTQEQEQKEEEEIENISSAPYNIIEILDIFSYHNNIHIVLDYMPLDLEQIIKDQSILLKPSDIKSYMYQLFQAIKICHDNWILHRDIKPSNCLITSNGILKLADFGLAKIYGTPKRLMSPQACTLWYRAPELLYGSKSYGTGCDIWSIGCVFAELLLGRPLFAGELNEISQLSRIFEILGNATEENWKYCTKLPNYIEFEKRIPKNLKDIFGVHVADDALDLLKNLLILQPDKRFTADQALNHYYFNEKNPIEMTKYDLLPLSKIDDIQTIIKKNMFDTDSD